MTPIMHACKTNDDNLVEELLKLAPDLQLKDQNGQNVLHYIIQGHENMTFDNKNMFQKVIDYSTPEDADSNHSLRYNVTMKNTCLNIHCRILTVSVYVNFPCRV